MGKYDFELNFFPSRCDHCQEGIMRCPFDCPGTQRPSETTSDGTPTKMYIGGEWLDVLPRKRL